MLGASRIHFYWRGLLPSFFPTVSNQFGTFVPQYVVPFAMFFCAALLSTQTQANGEIGEHVDDLQAHVTEYTEEVEWLIDRVDQIVARYADSGAAAAAPEALVDHWEAVKFHGAIETNFIPIYSSIWQGLFGVRLAIEGGEPLVAVQKQQALLEQTLWQALGAVRLAAQLQKDGVLSLASDSDAEESPQAALVTIKQQLDRVVAKYAERLPEEAIEIVQSTYLSRFEGIEGQLIEQDADLVEDLEVDFNVSLPKAIQDGQSVDALRTVVQSMQVKLDRAASLLERAESQRSSVF